MGHCYGKLLVVSMLLEGGDCKIYCSTGDCTRDRTGEGKAQRSAQVALVAAPQCEQTLETTASYCLMHSTKLMHPALLPCSFADFPL